jgi:hypothetical protein
MSTPPVLLKCRVRVMPEHVELDVAADQPIRSFDVSFRNVDRPGSVYDRATERVRTVGDDVKEVRMLVPLPRGLKVGDLVPLLVAVVGDDAERPAVRTGHDVRPGEWFDLLAPV